MTDLLEKAIAKLRKLPSERQDEAAELLMSIVEPGSDAIQLGDEQVAEVKRRLGDPTPYVTNAEVSAFFHKPTE